MNESSVRITQVAVGFLNIVVGSEFTKLCEYVTAEQAVADTARTRLFFRFEGHTVSFSNRGLVIYAGKLHNVQQELRDSATLLQHILPFFLHETTTDVSVHRFYNIQFSVTTVVRANVSLPRMYIKPGRGYEQRGHFKGIKRMRYNGKSLTVILDEKGSDRLLLFDEERPSRTFVNLCNEFVLRVRQKNCSYDLAKQLQVDLTMNK